MKIVDHQSPPHNPSKLAVAIKISLCQYMRPRMDGIFEEKKYSLQQLLGMSKSTVMYCHKRCIMVPPTETVKYAGP